MNRRWYRAQLLTVGCVLVTASMAETQPLMSAAPSTRAEEVRIDVLDLGTLVPGGTSAALAINNHGHVVGFADADSPDTLFKRQVPFFWTPQRGLQAIVIDEVPDLFIGLAQDINDRDDVIGYYFPFGGAANGFWWSPHHGIIHLGEEFLPVAINNRRQIVGICPGPDDGEFLLAVACIWEDFFVNSLEVVVGTWGHPPEGDELDINEHGHVVGSTVGAQDISRFGWVWTPLTGVMTLPLRSAYAINNAGQVVGHTSERTVVLANSGAVLRTARGDLLPRAINSRGSVVGTNLLPNDGLSPFLWRPNGDVTSLSSNDAYASDINNNAQIAGAVMVSHDRTRHAVVWTVHSPVHAALRIETPNQPSRWGLNTRHRLAWTYEGDAPQFQIDISRDGGDAWDFLSVVPNRVGGSQNFFWTVTGPTTANARLRVTAIADEEATDVNGADIRIGPAAIDILRPSGGTAVGIGSIQDIFFRHNLGARKPVALDVSDNGGRTWRTIVETGTTGSTTSSFQWGVDLLPTTRARIRVRALDGTGAAAMSGLFIVTSSTP
jgi:uncharacterized membrane protein